MNCSDFTSSNGNRNGKRNYGAANCGTRTKQYHNSSTDFFVRFLAPQKRSSERGGANELVPIFLRIRQSWRRNRCGNQGGPHTVSWFSPSKTEIASAT